MPIYQMVDEKTFRQDLLYRVNTVSIHIPPLRERVADIPLLTDYYLEKYCTKYNKPKRMLSSSAAKRLERYQWPGNVRELQHAIERAVIMSESKNLQPGDFFFSPQQGDKDSLHFDDLNLEAVEKVVVQKVLTKHSGNVSKAARELGLTRTSLYRRMEKYGL
jgi:transcriptional regulator with PAS, ATPase and Fis domain